MSILSVIAIVSGSGVAFFVMACLSGLWIDALVASRLLRPSSRALLLPVLGTLSLMVLVVNASYAGVPAGRGIWLALGISLALGIVVRRRIRLYRIPVRHLLLATAVVFGGIAVHTAPLARVGWITSVGLENGDWLTYVAHADYYRDHAFFDEPSPLDRTDTYDMVGQYRHLFFRIGGSQLFAAFAALTRRRGMYIFNIYCGFLTGLSALAFAFALRILCRVRHWTAVCGGLIYCLHPLVNWVGYAAFMPQLIGTSCVLVSIALIPRLLARRHAAYWWILYSFTGLALFVAYNEWVPLAGGTALGCFALWWRAVRSRWRMLARPAAIALAVAILACPFGVYAGLKGMAAQIQLSKVIGGGVQAIDQPIFFWSTIFGFVIPPPIPTRLPALWQTNSYGLLALELAVVAGFIILGIVRVRHKLKPVLIVYMGVSVLLSAYILTTYENDRLRTWSVYKLAQYSLPFVLLLIGAGIGSLRKRGTVAAATGAVLLLGVHTSANTVQMVRGVPRFPNNRNLPRYGATVTTVDQEFVEKINTLAGEREALLSLTPGRLLPTFPPSMGQLLYPRPIIGIDSDHSRLSHHRFRYAVEDRNLTSVRMDVGPLIWQNERFAVYRAETDRVWVKHGGIDAQMLAPRSQFVLQDCDSRSVLAIELYSFEEQEATIAELPAGLRLHTEIVGGQRALIVPIPSRPGSTRVFELRMANPAGLLSALHIKDKSRIEALCAMQSKRRQVPVPLAVPPFSGADWHLGLFDGTGAAPAIAFQAGGVSMNSDTLTSAGLTREYSLSRGWYALKTSFDIIEDMTGTGKGFGVGVLGLPRAMFFGTRQGQYEVQKAFFIERAAHYSVGVVLGGWGRNRGKGTCHFLTLEKLPGELAGGEAASLLPSIPSEAWRPVLYDRATQGPEVSMGEKTLNLKTEAMTSGGRGVPLVLRKGIYALEGEIRAERPAEGTGLGYGFGLVGVPGGMVFSAAAGVRGYSRLIVIPKDGTYVLAAIMGGFGKSRGAVQFRDLKLLPMQGLDPSGLMDTPGRQGVPEFRAGLWIPLLLDGTKLAPSFRLSGSEAKILADKPASFALVANLKIDPGVYEFQATIVAERPATGPGSGYGISLLGLADKRWFFREAGVHQIRKLICLDKPDVPLAAVLGGFGGVAGDATFRNLKLQKIVPFAGQPDSAGSSN